MYNSSCCLKMWILFVFTLSQQAARTGNYIVPRGWRCKSKGIGLLFYGHFYQIYIFFSLSNVGYMVPITQNLFSSPTEVSPQRNFYINTDCSYNLHLPCLLQYTISELPKPVFPKLQFVSLPIKSFINLYFLSLNQSTVKSQIVNILGLWLLQPLQQLVNSASVVKATKDSTKWVGVAVFQNTFIYKNMKTCGGSDLALRQNLPTLNFDG
jgi:hypothetical protein